MNTSPNLRARVLSTLARVWIGAATGVTLTAANLRIEVSGKNGTGGGLTETPKAAVFGNDATILGVILVPNGTLQMGQRNTVTGALVGRDVYVDMDSKVNFQSGLAVLKCAQFCNDGNPCTKDTCTGEVCSYPAAASGTSCSDGNTCNGAETCDGAGKCKAGTPVTCTALDQCHAAGVCDPTTGVCSNPTKADGTTCNDANACTVSDICRGGVCSGTTYSCDDGLACTTDTCNGTGGCTHTLAANNCLIGGACYASGAANPTNSCQQCTPATSTSNWTSKSNGTACSDGNACTKNDVCTGGSCGGTAYSCNDGIACTNDVCNGDGTCGHPVATGSCLIGGACYATGAVNPANQCQQCTPTTSQTAWSAKTNGTACSDGNACTKNDVCTAGTCGGTAYSCDDGLACTADACKGDGTCSHTIAAGNCAIAGACYAAGATSPTNQCQQCTPGTSQTAWSAKTNGTACNDGNACTQTDTCQSGACTGGNPVTCQPLDGCHSAGTCDQGTGICSNPGDSNGPACVVGDGWTPSTPLVLKAEALSSGVVRLTWTDVEGEDAYYVIRSTDGGSQFVQANQSAAGTTTWDDTARTPLTTYCYKVRAKSAAGYATSNMACVETPLTFEAENQTSSASDGAIAVVTDATASAGKYSKAPLAGAASWVEYLLDVPVTGTFRVKVRMATGPDRGRWRLQVEGKDASMELDGYASQPGNTEVDLGEVKIDSTTAQKHFRFLVTGKNAQSTGYVVAMDAFALFNVGVRYEAENSAPVVSPDDSETNPADTAASNGKTATTSLNAVGDFLQFTLSVPAPGKYQVVLRYKMGPDRGFFQARLDNATELGAEIDAYSASPAYATQVLAVVDIATAGPHTVTLEVTGKSGGSTGYGISVDYIELRPNPVINKISIGMEPVMLEATFGCGTQPDPQTKTGVADPAAPVSFTLPDQISMVVGNAGNQQATLAFRNGSGPAVTCTYQGATVSHPATKLEYVKGLKYKFQGCSNGAQPGASATATHFELALNGVDCQDSLPVAKARVHLGGSQCSDAVVDFISPDDTYTMRTQFSWAATQPVAETNAAGNPTLWYAMIYIHDDRQLDALDSVMIHHQKPPIFFTPGQLLPKLCGKLESPGDGEGYFEYALVTGAAFNKLRALALAAGADLGTQGLFKVIKITTPPVAGAANADGSVSIDFLISAGFRYMGYLAGQTVTHPDGTTDVITRPLSLNPLNWPGEVWDYAIGAGEWVWGQWGRLTNLLWPSATLSARLRAFSKDPAFQGQPLTHGWGKKAGQEIGIPGLHVNFWYASAAVLIGGAVLSPYGATTDAKGQLTVEVPEVSVLNFVEIPLDSDAAKISWNGVMTTRMLVSPWDVTGPATIWGDTSIEIQDTRYFNVLAQFADGREYLKQVVGYTPYKVRVAEGFAVNTYASANHDNAVTTCATFPNLVVYGGTFVAWLADVALAAIFPPALLLAIPFEQAALNSDMWLPDSDQAVVHSRGIWTHEYGHFALCSMIASNGAALSSLTTMTVQSILEGSSIEPGDEARILNEAFADFFTAQVAGGTNYYAPPASSWSNYISYCVDKPCLEQNMSATDTGSAVIARDITIFMDAFDGLNAAASMAPNAGDSWTESSTSPPTLAYTSQKYADSCLTGRATNNSNYWSSCDEFVNLSGPHLVDWVSDWIAHSSYLDHSSFMTALADTARTKGDFTWCDVCRLFAVHTPGNEGTPQDFGLTSPVPITQYSDVCLNSFIKDWIGPPPDPSLTNLDRVFNPRPYICEVCPVGSTPGPDRCICGPHQIPGGFDNLNCLQCAAGQIAVLVGPNWYCYDCGDGVPIDGQNTCQCNTGSTQASDGTCISACGPHEVWQGGQCVDCGSSTSYPDPTGTVCLSCPPSTPYCKPEMFDGKCYGQCWATCAPCYENPAPGSMICGPFTEALGCVL